jgi:hypothetical protein
MIKLHGHTLGMPAAECSEALSAACSLTQISNLARRSTQLGGSLSVALIAAAPTPEGPPERQWNMIEFLGVHSLRCAYRRATCWEVWAVVRVCPDSDWTSAARFFLSLSVLHAAGTSIEQVVAAECVYMHGSRVRIFTGVWLKPALSISAVAAPAAFGVVGRPAALPYPDLRRTARAP